MQLKKLNFLKKKREVIFTLPSDWYEKERIIKACRYIGEHSSVFFALKKNQWFVRIREKNNGPKTEDALIKFSESLHGSSFPSRISLKKPKKITLSCAILLTHNFDFVRNVQIPSIIANTPPNIGFEIILVVNNPHHKIGKIDGVKVVKSIPFLVPEGYNKGIKAAKGEYIALFHDDCVILDKKWFEKCKNLLNDKVIAVSPDIDTKMSKHRGVRMGVMSKIKCAPLFMKREKYHEMGCFDEMYPLGNEDLDFTFNILSKGFDFKQVDMKCIHCNGLSTLRSALQIKGLDKRICPYLDYNLIPYQKVKMLLKEAESYNQDKERRRVSKKFMLCCWLYLLDKYKDYLEKELDNYQMIYNKLNDAKRKFKISDEKEVIRQYKYFIWDMMGVDYDKKTMHKTINEKPGKSASAPRKKVLLISPPHLRLSGEDFINFPYNLCCLASAIRKEGWMVGVYNMEASSKHDKRREFLKKFPNLHKLDLMRKNLEKDYLGVWMELVKVIKMLKPDIVGITALTADIIISLKIAKIVKKINPKISVILGGIHATVKYSSLIKNKNLDFIVRGEGEKTITELLAYLEKCTTDPNELNKIDGLSYKANGKAYHNKDRKLINNIDELPIPARDLFVFPSKYTPNNFGLIMASRGCPFSCKFCSSKFLWSNKVRFRTVDNVIREIKFLINKYGTSKFMFLDDDFCINKDMAKRICSAIIKNNIKMEWKCQVRLNSVDGEILDYMKKAGCKQLAAGIESGSDDILKYINKELTTKQVKEKVSLINKKDIPITLSFIIGFPEEKAKDIEKTMRLMQELPIKRVALSFFVPYPSTFLYNECKKLGLLGKEKDIDWLEFLTTNKRLSYMKYLTEEQKKSYMERILKIIKQINSRKGYKGLPLMGVG